MEGRMEEGTDLVYKDTKLQDKQIQCCDCGLNFIWTAGEQRYFFAKQLSTPKRCPDCRRIRRQTIVPDGGNGGETSCH